MEEIKEKIIKLKKIRIELIITLVILLLLAIPIILYIVNTIEGIKIQAIEQMNKSNHVKLNMHNAKIKYLGENVKGSEVKILIEEIISSNNQNVEREGEFISVQAKNIENYTNQLVLSNACKACNNYENEEADYNMENLSKATEQMIELKSQIKANKKYKVTAEQKDGNYYSITIEEV